MMETNQSCLPSGYWSRRDSLRFLGAAALGVSLPLTVSPLLAIRVIGVGDAGCNIVLAAWSGGMPQTDGYQSKFACVTMGQQSSQAISQANQLHSGLAPIREVQLGPFGAGAAFPSPEWQPICTITHFDLWLRTLRWSFWWRVLAVVREVAWYPYWLAWRRVLVRW